MSTVYVYTHLPPRAHTPTQNASFYFTHTHQHKNATFHFTHPDTNTSSYFTQTQTQTPPSISHTRTHLHRELGHRVGDLLEEDGQEPRVETADDPLGLEDLGEGGHETVRVGRVRDETDASGLEGAEEDVGHKLSGGGGAEVDGQSVFPRLTKINKYIQERRRAGERERGRVGGTWGW